MLNSSQNFIFINIYIHQYFSWLPNNLMDLRFISSIYKISNINSIIILNIYFEIISNLAFMNAIYIYKI
jgi:hypothetical protein